jgi:hypothetical protein
MSPSSKEYQRQWRAKNPNYHKNYLDNYRLTLIGRVNNLIGAAKYRSKNKNGEVTITPDWLLGKLNLGFCEITGLPFDFSSPVNTKNNLNAPSLDRIDSSNPNYSVENTRVVLWAVNRLHGDDTLESLLPILEAVVTHLKSK